MGLDIYLNRKVYLSYDEGKTYMEKEESVYSDNLTHNLNVMADIAGLYEALWRPHRLRKEYNIPEKDHEVEWAFEDANPIKAEEIVSTLEDGLKKLKADPEYFKQFNPENGWGTYEQLVKTTEKYLEACKEYPKALIEVSR